MSSEASFRSTLEAEASDWRGTERYDVVRCIGRGAMGVVYEARDQERRQRVALKTLQHFSPDALLLFKQEFRILANVQHPNLVRLYELVAADGERVFFSMELVRGTNFLTYVQKAGALTEGTRPWDETSPNTLQDDAVSRVKQLSTLPSAEDAAPSREATRCASTADLDRLRPALRQLVEGVQALHSVGKVHRDLKPSNVVVTPEGRVVILDFGIATDIAGVADESLRDDAPTFGTACYMAPEHAVNLEATRASDWYSVGVMLYEALVGNAPFEGASPEVLRSKAAFDAPPPSEFVDGVPQDLEALCVALLDRDPANRPSGPEMLRRLGGLSALSGTPTTSVATPLVGREPQLRALRDAFDCARSGRSVTVHVGGRAGMGKSALVQHFLDGLVKNGEAVILRGRAYERESVPYKAVDAVIDALSRYLMHVSDDEGTIALPKDIIALARLFPVLARIPAVRAISAKPNLEPTEVRRRAFGALRQLMTTLARRRPLVVYIDDVQWGDTDSAALLLELARPPMAPSLLVVLAHREEDAQTAPFLREVRTRWPLGAEARDVSVGPLDLVDMRRLSLAIIGSSDEASAEPIAAAAARESGGSPLLVEELTRSSMGRRSTDPSAQLTLEQMVGERLRDLPDDARCVAELVAIGGRPLPWSVVGEAAGIVLTDDMVALLCTRRILRSGLRNGREVVEPLHDRIREAIVALLPATAARQHHGRLAQVLEATPGADPEAVAVHLLGVGKAARAARFAERAAKQAVEHLAFDHAARLYRLTIDALPADSPKVSRLRRCLGEVLGWAGRSEEAGRVFLAAAEGVSPSQRFEFERPAAAQLIAAGRIEEGGQVLRRLLVHAGVGVPTSPWRVLLWIIVYGWWLRLVGLKFRERVADDVRPEDHSRIEAMAVAALGLASVDPVLAMGMGIRHLVEALRKGDRGQVLRAMLLYAHFLAILGGPPGRHERAVLATIARVVGTGANPGDVALAGHISGVRSFVRGRWREALDTLDGAYANLPKQVAGWQQQASIYAVYSLVFLGDFVELRRRHAAQVAGADQRGDRFTAVLLGAFPASALWLAADDPEAARREMRDALDHWPRGKFLLLHWQVMRSEAEIELYASEGIAAYARLQQDERSLKRSLLFAGNQYVRANTAFVRGRAAILSADADPPKRTERLAEAKRLARHLQREQMTWIAPLAAILTAGVANAMGDRARAIASLQAAVDLATAAEMLLYSEAARYSLGLALGDKGLTFKNQAEDAMCAQGIRAPARFAAMLVPGRWNSDAI